MLGILMGVAALIAVQAIGDGAQKAMQTQLQSFGTNLLLVFPGAAPRAGVAQATGSGSRAKFAQGDLAPLMEAVPLLSQVSGEVSGHVQATSNDKNWNTTVFGTSVEYVSMQDSQPPLGRWFTEQERLARERVAVVGVTVARNLWGDADPVGQTLRLNRIAFAVIGVLPAKGMNGFQDQDDRVLVPNATAQYRLPGQGVLRCRGPRGAGCRPHPRRPGAGDGLLQGPLPHPPGPSRHLQHPRHVRPPASRRRRRGDHGHDPEDRGGHLAAGGRHRHHEHHAGHRHRAHPREIGLRKALGAKRRDILSQFIIESLAISLCGGAIGFLLGGGVSLAIGLILGWPIFISPASVLLATGFSSGVGLIFGLWPAWTAARIEPHHGPAFGIG